MKTNFRFPSGTGCSGRLLHGALHTLAAALLLFAGSACENEDPDVYTPPAPEPLAPLTLVPNMDPRVQNDIEIEEETTGVYRIHTTGEDPYFCTVPFDGNVPADLNVLAFEYQTDRRTDHIQLFFWTEVDGEVIPDVERTIVTTPFEAADTWKEYSVRIRKCREEFFWGEAGNLLRIDFGTVKDADIRLRNINKEYILKRTQEVDSLEAEIEDLQATVNDPKRIRKIIIGELTEVRKKYAVPRRTDILYEYEAENAQGEEDDTPDYPVHLFLSREGYLKKITPQSLRMASDQKYKEGDGPFLYWEGNNRDELLVFTDRQQCYKTRLSEFDDSKASVLGDYLPTKLGMDGEERVLWACIPGDYSGQLLFCFENGKTARVELSAYQTQTRRKKLTGAYSDKSPLVTAFLLREELELALYSSDGRCMVFHTAVLAPKTTRTTQGVNVMALKPKRTVTQVLPLAETAIVNAARYRARSLPVAGAILREEDRGEKQLSLLE